MAGSSSQAAASAGQPAARAAGHGSRRLVPGAGQPGGVDPELDQPQPGQTARDGIEGGENSCPAALPLQHFAPLAAAGWRR